jgi:PhnB protein
MAIQGGLGVGQLGVTLIVQDVTSAVDFYRTVLGAQEIRRHSSPIPTDSSGPEVHGVELRLADTFLIVAKENPRWRDAPRPDWPRSPLAAGAASATFTLYVDDVDEVLARAIAAGASPQLRDSQPEDAYWGDRVVQFHDPAGHVWRIQTRLEDVTPDELPARFEAHRQAHRAGAQARR